MFGFDPELFWGVVAAVCFVLGVLLLWIRAGLRSRRIKRIRRNIQRGIQTGVVTNPKLLPRPRGHKHDDL